MRQWLYDVMMMSFKWPIWLKRAKRLEMGCSTSNGPFGTFFALTVSNGWGASRWLYRTHWGRTLPGGPSHNGPMPVRCLRGVAVLSSFPKGLVSISVFQTFAFPKRSIYFATLLQFLPWLHLFALGRLRDGSPTTRQPRILKQLLQRNTIITSICKPHTKNFFCQKEGIRWNQSTCCMSWDKFGFVLGMFGLECILWETLGIWDVLDGDFTIGLNPRSSGQLWLLCVCCHKKHGRKGK